MDAMLKNFLLGVLAPAAACAAVVIGARRPWRAEGVAERGRWGLPAGFAACFVMALGVSVAWSWPGIPPNSSWLWLAYLVPAACAWGAAESSARLPESVCVGARLGMAALTGWLIAHERVEPLVLWRAIGAGLVAALALGLPPLLRRTSGASLPIVLCGTTGVAAVIAVLAWNARLGQIAGALALGLAATIVVGWWRPAASLGRGAAAPVAVAVPGILLSARFGADSGVPDWAFIAAAVAPLAAWVGEVRPVARLRPWLRASVRIGAVVAAAGTALAAAYLATAGEEPWY